MLQNNEHQASYSPTAWRAREALRALVNDERAGLDAASTCVYCGRNPLDEDERNLGRYVLLPGVHNDDCPIAQARALLTT